MTKPELTAKLNEEVTSLAETLSKIDNDAFFRKAGSKWSIAENTQHLVLSAKPLNMAFSLPKILPRLLFGKPYRKSYPYDEIVKRYKQLLTDGAVATSSYVPKAVPLKGDKTELVNRLKKTYEILSTHLQQWSEEDLDGYFLPHPLLGKLTVREMYYFTAHHVHHHHETIMKLKA